jgi:hypothetical protein
LPRATPWRTIRRTAREGDGEAAIAEQRSGRQCAWCDADAPGAATHCPACGAALAQREDLAGLVISGVTSVDPALQAFDAQPHHLRGNSPTQALAGGVAVAAAAGGPIGLVALGGIAAVAAGEYLGARRDGPATPAELDAVGRPSEAALQAAARLDRGEDPAEGRGEGRGDADVPPAPTPEPVVDGSAANSDNSTRD